MAAIYDIQVRNQLYEYEKSLVKYPISANRRKMKIKNLRVFLQRLSNNPQKYPVCNKKKLGQIFNSKNKPLNLILRQTTYKDESNTQWSISFFQVSKNVVKIYRLIQTKFIYESIMQIYSLMERMDKLY